MKQEIKDISIYYETIGIGIPIIMIHGTNVDHRLMKGCMEPIFEKYNLPFKRIYFDLPGMGQTEGKEWIDGSDRMLDLVSDFINSIIPNEHFLVAGESYGGYLARGIIYRNSTLVDGLLLLCSLADPKTRRDTAPPLTVLAKDSAFMETLTDEERYSFELMTVNQIESVWTHYKKDILSGVKCADHKFIKNCLNKNIQYTFQVESLNKPFMKPTLMLMGRQDSAVGYKDMWNILEFYPRASFVILDKAGHNLQIEQIAIFEVHVIEWLNSVLFEKQ
jgi:pimeloyl-ACP methyl ester carboxylesterase